jgi:hypothetical protein
LTLSPAVPPPVSWWPPAPGWYVVGALAVALAVWSAWRGWERWRAAVYRRAALAELRRLERRAADGSQHAAALREVPALVKRTALAAYPLGTVASLSGPDCNRRRRPEALGRRAARGRPPRAESRVRTF